MKANNVESEKGDKSENKRTENKNINKLILNEKFPEVNNLFSPNVKSIGEVGSDSIVVLDTNVLLLPYNISVEGFNTIENIYRKLKQNNKIFIPDRVVKEFASNRGGELTKVHQRLLDHKSKKPNFSLAQSPLYSKYEEFNKIKELENNIKEIYKEYMRHLDSMVNYVENYSWNDPISNTYNELFNDIIINTDLNDQEIIADSEKRNMNNIPPGFKDKSKDDGGIGDKIIWQTILFIGKEYKQNLIFVTNEEKPDWWHSNGAVILYPRFELVDEYRRTSGGKSFNMLSFSNFLKIFTKDNKVVEEVRKEEINIVLAADMSKVISRSSIVHNLIKEVDIFILGLSRFWIKNKADLYDVANNSDVYRRISNRIANDYNHLYRDDAIRFRDQLLDELDMRVDFYRNNLYSSSDNNQFPDIRAIIDDLKGLSDDLLQQYPS